MQPAQILQPRPQGIYCPKADLYIDPTRPVERALITHGHSDHARAGHGRVLATAETLAIMGARYGAEFAGSAQALRYGERLDINGVTFSLHSAGHVLGSAQAAAECGGTRVVASGDYKRQPDPTCAPFEVVPCDVFITEATFALPVFTHPSAEHEVRKLLASVAMFPERAHIVGAYALGKAQRVMATLRACGWDKPIYVHGALMALTDLYQKLGVELGEIRHVTDAKKSAYEGAIVLCPPGALQTPWVRRFPDPVTSVASGWMRIRARARQQGAELPLVISDHADWGDLRRTIKDTGAGEIWITHGEADALAHWCEGQGLKAKALHLVGYGDEGEPAGAEPGAAA
ncbi:ligase-associated DNA damage response exonuclease [Terricaulis silvestris]|uniref:Ribonuclease n=1 Tax=Terricaulis silvestris TaxID=2686094 RepID=A0A6I6MMS6_9CAUL|nr:ligase-associated DNA damage response exonuclease [Terricaulis silvestris]QGZ94576.1 Ribonuclease [Terricaulis silvestris]